MKNKAARQMIDSGWIDGVPNFPYPTVSVGGLRGDIYAMCREVRINNLNLLKSTDGIEVITGKSYSLKG